MTSAEKTHVALVGLGSAGLVHLQSVVQLPHMVQLSWVVDIDERKAQRIAAEHGCRWSTDLGDALADVDAVIIASATDTHFPYIMESLRANKAVLTEKPISHKLHEVVEAVELAKSRNLPFVCGYQRRADRHFRTLKQQLDTGTVGKMKLVKTCSRDNPLPPLEYLRASGGIFHDMLIHDFDMLDLLSNGEEPESVTAIGHCYNSEIQEMNDIDTCAVMFKYASGTMAMVDASRDASYGCDQRIEVFGEKGMLTARSELTSTVELATSAGHLRPPAMCSSPQPYLQACRSRSLSSSCALEATARRTRRSMSPCSGILAWSVPHWLQSCRGSLGARCSLQRWAGTPIPGPGRFRQKTCSATASATMSSAWSAPLQGPRRPRTQYAPARLLEFVLTFVCCSMLSVCHGSCSAEANSQRTKHNSKCFAVAARCFAQAGDGTLFVGILRGTREDSTLGDGACRILSCRGMHRGHRNDLRDLKTQLASSDSLFNKA